VLILDATINIESLSSNNQTIKPLDVTKSPLLKNVPLGSASAWTIADMTVIEAPGSGTSSSARPSPQAIVLVLVIVVVLNIV
jgi:hypothetical protein